MTLEDFLQKYNRSPYSLEEVSLILTQVEDEEIQDTVQKYLDAKHNLEIRLIEIGFEFG